VAHAPFYKGFLCRRWVRLGVRRPSLLACASTSTCGEDDRTHPNELEPHGRSLPGSKRTCRLSRGRVIEHHLAKLFPLLVGQPRFAARVAAVVKPGQTFCIVAHHRITQRLPLHPCQTRRRRGPSLDALACEAPSRSGRCGSTGAFRSRRGPSWITPLANQTSCEPLQITSESTASQRGMKGIDA
jgi:hypothetical protein